jgi:hypothetical protein
MSCIDPFGACDKMGNAIPSTNSGSRGVDEDEILLHMPSKPVSKVETIVEAAVDEDNWVGGLCGTKVKRESIHPLIFERGQNHNFKYTKSYDEAKQRDHEDYFWEKCYPNLFPYGRGGPSDIRYCRSIKLSKFIQHMLQRGGNVVGMKQGRRFQMDARFIFPAYILDSRRRLRVLVLLLHPIQENLVMQMRLELQIQI